MKMRSRLRELPEIIQTYIRGFLGMTAVVAVLSLLALILHFKEQ